MSVKVEAEGADYFDAMRKLGRGIQRSLISVRVRRGRDTEFGRRPAPGCIVEVEGEAVPMEFTNAEAAIEYIGGFLRNQDATAAEFARDEQQRVKVK